jgi:hypothetical protein
MIAAPMLVLAASLWTGAAWGRREDSGPITSRGSRIYRPPVDLSPEVLCGGTEALKNYA